MNPIRDDPGAGTQEITLQQATLIACVDDDPTVLKAMEDLLDAAGFEVDGFSWRRTFLTAANSKRRHV